MCGVCQGLILSQSQKRNLCLLVSQFQSVDYAGRGQSGLDTESEVDGEGLSDPEPGEDS